MRSSLISSSTPGPSIGPLDRDRDAGPGHRVEAGVRPHPLEVGGELVDRDVAARAVLDERLELLVEHRDLAPELVVAGVEVRDEHRQVLRGQLGETGVAGLRAELDDDEQAEHEGDGRDRELAAAAVHAQSPAARLGAADGEAEGWMGRE